MSQNDDEGDGGGEPDVGSLFVEAARAMLAAFLALAAVAVVAWALSAVFPGPFWR